MIPTQIQLFTNVFYSPVKYLDLKGFLNFHELVWNLGEVLFENTRTYEDFDENFQNFARRLRVKKNPFVDCYWHFSLNIERRGPRWFICTSHRTFCPSWIRGQEVSGTRHKDSNHWKSNEINMRRYCGWTFRCWRGWRDWKKVFHGLMGLLLCN